MGYRPGMRSSNTNLNGSDLQLQNLNRQGQPPLPSIDSLWDRLEAWLDEEYPELYDSLNDGVTSADLNEFEKDLGCGSLPVEFRHLYKKCDGQFLGGKPTGLFMGLVFLDLESSAEEHTIWGKVAQRIEKQQQFMAKQKNLPAVPDEENGPVAGSSSGAGGPGAVAEAANRLQQLNVNNTFIGNQRSIPPNSIQPVYSHRGWIPICRDYFGNQIAVDVAPGPQGNWGQVIIFGRDFDTKLVIASGLQEFLFNFITDLENGNFQIDQTDTNASFGYLEASRNDDDFIGDEDEGQGELNFYDKEKEFGKLGSPLTYLEVLKRRTLKKYGITNVEKFLTSFVPQNTPHYPPRRSGVNSKNPSPARSAAASTTDLSKVTSPLINVESKVNLPRETLILAGEASAETGPAKQPESAPEPAPAPAPEPEPVPEPETKEGNESEPVEPEAKESEPVEPVQADKELKSVDL